ncbi:hypothetical protein [Nitrospirillum sp. BR 11163]|uniref:hypothetical protein n=1 Tax=Nitrospirillum sp. BR 11163 TaxID=3104323 RepID=UPI002AFECBE7|nr:hypothetical protein [Nitrospirillum sp. BR 11163]MEA1674470.1 hypothetical protein [Nitrospirillum sp. BR 11163]
MQAIQQTVGAARRNDRARALLAGTSALAIVTMLTASGIARADTIVSTPVAGPITDITGGLTITNTGTITGAGTTPAVYTRTTLTNVLNAGTIQADGTAFVNATADVGVRVNGTLVSSTYYTGDIATFTNQAGGVIRGGASTQAVGLYNTATIGTLTNAGLITGGANAIVVQDHRGNSASVTNTITHGIIDQLVNVAGGTIQSGSKAILDFGTIGTLTNSGIVSGTGAVALTSTGHMATLANFGVLSGSHGAVASDGAITLVENHGTINGGTVGVFNFATTSVTGSLAQLTNVSGATIVGGQIAIINSGVTGTLRNDGTIVAYSRVALENDGTPEVALGLLAAPTAGTIGGTIGVIVNNGVIRGVLGGVVNTLASGAIGTISNLGAILGTDANEAVSGHQAAIANGGVIGGITNGGTVGGWWGISNAGTITQVTNQGTIIGTRRSAVYNSGKAGTLSNSVGGVISGATDAYGVVNGTQAGVGGSIGTLTNSGTLTGGSGIGNVGDQGGVRSTIATLVNAAGGGISAVGGTVNGNPVPGIGIQNVNGVIGLLNNAGVIAGRGPSLGLGTVANVYVPEGIQNAGGTINTLTNTGSIFGTVGISNEQAVGPIIVSGTTTSGGALQAATIGTATNLDGALIRAARTGVANSGAIGTLNNYGTLIGSTGAGIANLSTIGIATISAGTASNAAIYAGRIGTLANGGIISGLEGGVVNPGSIGIIVNGTAGTILSTDRVETDVHQGGIENTGTIGSLSNRGSIGGWWGVRNAGGVLLTMANSGTIAGTDRSGVYNWGGIGALVNLAGGVISGVTYAYGVVNATNITGHGVIGTITNSGTIVGGSGVGNNGSSAQSPTIGTILNTGLINAVGGTVYGVVTPGVGVQNIFGAIAFITDNGSGTLGTGSIVAGGASNGANVAMGVENYAGSIGIIRTNATALISGSIGISNEADMTPVQVGASGTLFGTRTNGTITDIVNGGTVRGATAGIANSGVIGTVTNTGTLVGTTQFGLRNSGTVSYQTLTTVGTAVSASTHTYLYGGGIGTVYNSGTIRGVAAGLNNQSTDSTIGLVDNAGLITASSSSSRNYGLDNLGTIGALLNEAAGIITSTWYGVRNNNAIGTLDNAGQLTGGERTGVSNQGGSIGTLINEASGLINGNTISYGLVNTSGGVYGAGTITNLTNNGRIFGGTGLGNFGGQSGTRLTVHSTIGTLTNNGEIAGIVSAIAPAAGVQNANGYIALLVNNGTIDASGSYAINGSITVGNMAIDNLGGTIATLGNNGAVTGSVGVMNEGMITQGVAGAATLVATIGTLVNAGTIAVDDVGIANSGTILSLSNSGSITGGNDGLAAYSRVINQSTTAVVLGGRIGVLTNSGLIGGNGYGIDLGAGTIDSIVNLAGGSIGGTLGALTIGGTGVLGTLVNSGIVAGNIINNSSRDLVVVGGSGDTYGLFTDLAYTGRSIAGATITNTFSNMVLSSGNVALDGSVVVNVGSHTLTNTGSATLRLDTIVNVVGNYAQGGSGALLIDVASTSIYGGLNVTGNAAISGGAIILNAGSGFDLVDGQTYTIVAAKGGSSYAGYNLVAPGHSLTATATTIGGLTDLVITIGGGGNGGGGSIGGGTIGSIGSGGIATIGGGANVGTVSGGTVNVSDGSPTIGTIGSGSTVNIGAGSSPSVGEVSGGLVNLSAGGTIAGTQTVNVSGGSVAVAGTITAPVAVSGGDVSIASGGVVNTSTPIQVSSGSLSIASGGVVASDKPVTVSGGNVNVSGVIAAPVQVNSGTASVSISSGGVVTQSVTASAGSVNVAGTITAPVTVSGGNVSVASGGTIVSSQPVQVTGGSLSISGNVNAPVQVSGTTVSASQIASATPVMTVDAGGTISQSVTVDAGKVSMNGTISGNVAIGSGGALRGAGVVTGQASVSGILAPGNSPGTLTFTNGLTQAAKSVLSIDIDGTGTGAGYGNYSRVLVTGGSYVIGSGAVLQPNLRGMSGKATNTYTPGLGTDFTIVQAAGGVQGTFASITQPGSGLLAGTQFTALYGGNAIDLYVTPTYGSLASLGANTNQRTMGRVVAGLTGAGNADLNTVLKALYGLPTVGASLDALAQIGGGSQANIVAYSLNRGLAVTQVLGQRLAAVRDGVAGGMQGTMQAQLVGRTLYTSVASGGDAVAMPVADERGAAAGSAPEAGWHFWAQGLGAFTRVDSDGNAAGGHSNTGGGLFGGDRTVAPGVTVGLAGVLLQSTSGGSNETSSYGLSAYGNVDLGDGLFVTGNAGYTYDQYDTARTLGFGGLSRTAFGHTKGDELSAGVTAGYRVRVSNLTLEPQAGIQWLKVGRDGFTETGAGALDLVLQDLDATALQSSVGGRASASWKTDGGTVITPALRAAWLHDFRDRALTSQAALAGTTFAVTGPDTGANALGIGGGLTLQEGDNLNLYANYDGTLRRHETDHVFTAGFRLSW